jgi:hypothetical protein
MTIAIAPLADPVAWYCQVLQTPVNWIVGKN